MARVFRVKCQIKTDLPVDHQGDGPLPTPCDHSHNQPFGPCLPFTQCQIYGFGSKLTRDVNTFTTTNWTKLFGHCPKVTPAKMIKKPSVLNKGLHRASKERVWNTRTASPRQQPNNQSNKRNQSNHSEIQNVRQTREVARKLRNLRNLRNLRKIPPPHPKTTPVTWTIYQ